MIVATESEEVKDDDGIASEQYTKSDGFEPVFDSKECYCIQSQNPLVTALICNYNYGRYLSDAIESVLAQTWQRLEIIVVDDGSTDESRAVLEDYRDRIRLIFKENGGQASAFNVGIAAARGEIICFLDSDDFWYPEKVERIVNKYKEYPWGLVCHDMHEVDKTGKRMMTETYTQRNGITLCSGDLFHFVKENGFPWMFVPTSGMSLLTNIAKTLLPLPEEEWRICADNPLAYAAICHAPVGIVDGPLSAYRYHGSNGFAFIHRDRITSLYNSFIFPVSRYCFLSNYIARVWNTVLDKEPKDSYRYFRYYCFIAKENSWKYLPRLWELNICHHFNFKIKTRFRYFNVIKFFLIDSLLTLSFFLHIPSPYRILQKRYPQDVLKLSTCVRNYLEKS